jgi:hypothetical protein
MRPGHCTQLAEQVLLKSSAPHLKSLAPRMAQAYDSIGLYQDPL